MSTHITLELLDAIVRIASERLPLAEQAAKDLGRPFSEITHDELFNRMYQIEREQKN